MADETKESSLSGTAGEKSNNGQFQKGDDPRRYKKGPVSKERLAFNKSFRELLVKEGKQKQIGTIGDKENTKIVRLKKVEWLVKAVWQQAIKGESWAVNFIADRVEGKVTQPIDMKGSLEILSIKDMKESIEEFDGNTS